MFKRGNNILSNILQFENLSLRNNLNLLKKVKLKL